MKKSTLSMFRLTAIIVMALFMFSCGEDPVDPPTVQISSSVDGYQVAFTALATNTDTYAWDFGNGETSTEQNPVYIYPQSGTYTATLTVTGEGGTADATETITISASELEMLTGGPSMAEGKSWVLSSTDGVTVHYADADLTLDEEYPAGVLGILGLASEYADEYTFVHDLSFTQNPVNDSVIANAYYTTINGIGSRPSGNDLLVLAPFTPAAATFTYTEDTDLILTVIPDQDFPDVTEDVTWSNQKIIETTGTGFLGIQDYQRKYIVFEISADKLVLGIFIYSSGVMPTIIPIPPTHLLKMALVPKQ